MRTNQRIISAIVIIILSLVVIINTPTTLLSSALLYKSYVVRQDRGRDILCDPYIVQKNDYVLKIFKQRGEIAHADFPEFLKIFRRINPQVANINRIRPGQHIFIPLKKLAPHSHPDQSSGIVTIPFVTLSTLPDLLKENTGEYIVKRGDTVSRLLSRSFAKYGTREYKEGFRIFQLMNPDISDPNQIYIGQRLLLPNSALRNEPWYTSLFDNTGDISNIAVPTAKTTAPKPLPPRSALEKAARLLDARLFNKGTYYFPRPGTSDFQLELARHPILEFPGRHRLVIAPPSETGIGIGDADLSAMKSFWKSLSVLPVEPDAPVERILDAFFNSMEKKPGESRDESLVSFMDQGVRVSVRARWWLNQSGKTIGFTPITGEDRNTPDLILDYLAKHGISLKEFRETTEENTPEKKGPPLNISNKSVDAGIAKAWVPALLDAMNFSYAPNIPITFPYGGIQIPAVSNLISTPDGISVLVDFGDLYGEAISAIESSGLNVIQIEQTETLRRNIQRLLDGLGRSYEMDPAFSTAGTSGDFGATISIPGFLISMENLPETLLAMVPLDPALVRYLHDQGLNVIKIMIPDAGS